MHDPNSISFTNEILKQVTKIYRFVGTAGTQCLATSAPFPFKTSTDLQKEHKRISYYNNQHPILIYIIIQRI